MRRPIPFTIALTCAFVFGLLAVGCSGPPAANNTTVNTNAVLTATPTPVPPIDCNMSPTDAEIAERVYAMLAYKNPEYAKQYWQFNVTAKAVNKEVTITGWSGMRGQIIQDAGSALKNCKPINVTNFVADRSALTPQLRVGCPPNYAPCGDICVPAGEPCKVTSELQSAPGNAPVCYPEHKADTKPPKAK